MQLVPSNLSQKASPRAQELPAEAAYFGTIRLEGAQPEDVVQIYATASGRRRTDSAPLWGTGIYLHATQALSKPEASYALETLLNWSGLRIILGDDNTFRVERS